MRFIVLDRQEHRQKNLHGEATHNFTVNGYDTITITGLECNVQKGYRLLYQDKRGVWREFIVSSIDEIHDADGVHYAIYAENSLIEIAGDYISDLRNIEQGADVALSKVLSSSRWTGEAEQLGVATVTYYRTTGYDALSKTLEAFSCEFETEIIVTGNVVSNRILHLRKQIGQNTGKRFSFQKDMLSIKRTFGEQEVVSRLYGFGKGEEIGDGYGRRLTFASVNNGKEYVENSVAMERYGYKGRPFSAVKTFDDVTDPELLKRLTEEALAQLSQPQITYEASVVDLSDYGFDFEGCGIGDTVKIRDKDLNLAIEGRVLELEEDPDGIRPTRIVLGSYRSVYDQGLYALAADVERLVSKEGAYDAIVDVDQGILMDQVVNALNAQFDAHNSYVHYDPSVGFTITDNKDIDQSTWAMQLGALGFRIADNKLPNGEWNWRTFGTGKGLSADVITAGILQGGNSVWNLETGYINIGDGQLVYDPATNRLLIQGGDITGATGQDGKDGVGVVLSVTEYAYGGCEEIAPTDGWVELTETEG